MGFEQLVYELKGTTGKIEKESILDYYLDDEEEGDFIESLLCETFDPNVLHHVVLKKKDIPAPGNGSLYGYKEEVLKLFDYLHNELSPAKNKTEVMNLMSHLDEESQECLMGVVNKKLRCGVSLKTINKVSLGLIDVTPIPLANKYSSEDEHKYGRSFFSSNKLDGQRIFCVRDHSGWKKYSRAGDYLGNEVTTLSHWDIDLDSYYNTTGLNFLDGEAYNHGMTFEAITRLIKSTVNVKDASVLEYHIFYAGKFFDLKEAALQNEVNGVRPNFLFDMFKPYKYLVGVKQVQIPNDESVVYEEIDVAVAHGYEGIMLRSIDTWCEFKRSHNLLKAKKSELSGTVETRDVYVEDIEYGEMAVREGGKEAVENLPVALLVTLPEDPTTKVMKVGSGFSLDQRREWADDESLIVGHMAEVEFQGYGSKGSMRFPRFMRVRTDL